MKYHNIRNSKGQFVSATNKNKDTMSNYAFDVPHKYETIDSTIADRVATLERTVEKLFKYCNVLSEIIDKKE